jgi:hypothetical protein
MLLVVLLVGLLVVLLVGLLVQPATDAMRIASAMIITNFFIIYVASFAEKLIKSVKTVRDSLSVCLFSCGPSLIV